MSKKFKIAKRVNHYDIEDFEDVEIEDDFIDENMVQIISDNEYDPMYNDCETIAVALQLAGYGKVADLEAKLAALNKEPLNCSQIENGMSLCIIQKSKIVELEAKLAESEDTIIFADKAVKGLNLKIKDLEKQLADKDEEIEVLKQRLKDTIKIYSDDFVEKDKELKELRFQKRNIFPLVENLEDKVNQDKISFCIEKLEKVKDFLHSGYAIDNEEIEKEIDNQIEELKKENLNDKEKS